MASWATAIYGLRDIPSNVGRFIARIKKGRHRPAFGITRALLLRRGSRFTASNKHVYAVPRC